MTENKNAKCKRMKSFHYITVVLYFLAIALMAFIIIINIIMRTPKDASYGQGDFQTMNDHWVTKTGEEFEITKIDSLREQDSDTVSIYYQLPDTIDQNYSIVFRSKNCLVKVYSDTDLLYETAVASAPFYNHSPGTRWNIINLNAQDSGKILELQIKQAYQDGRAKVDNFYIGDRAALMLHLIQAKAGGLVVSLLIFFVGLVFIATWFILNGKRTPRNNSLLWLSLFAMIASSWSMLETNLFQLFSNNLELIQVTDNMMLVLGGIPLYLYLDSVFGVFRFRFVRVLSSLNISYVLLATLSQILGLWDYHQTLNGAILTYGIVTIILIVCIYRNKNSITTLTVYGDFLFHRLQLLGMAFLGLGLTADLIRYLSSDVMDRAFFIRIGLLGFIIFFGAENILHLIYLVQKGLEADLISHLAYQDGLTRTGNRTAYMEKLEHLLKENPRNSLVLVMFDINNLKRVNDTFGHQVGDELILNCANLIKQAFPTPFHIYRIGGDEFISLAVTPNPQKTYEDAHKLLNTLIHNFNNTCNFVSPIAIAHGAAFLSDINAENIAIAEKEADLNMYRHKYELKAAE